ncbi:MAG: PqqD family protein [Muribaculaceae bacterium]|nr:PqqD family protein [Muribaculaceae bacterium]
MKKTNGLMIRRLGTEAMLVAESTDLIDFDRIVSLNSSAAYIWESLPDTDFGIDTIAGLLTDRYDVDDATARADARELADIWLKAGAIHQ